ncbi:MAG: trypsin-like peptidase domain-containing protein [Dehalococcoidia bacterium]
MKFGSTFLMVVVSMLAGAGIVAGITLALDRDDGASSPRTDTTSSSQPVSSQPSDSEGSDGTATDFSALYGQVRDSIVRITLGEDDDPFSGGSEGLGSGIVLDTDGRILTNYHVVRGFDEVTVTFSDGTTVQAEVLGRDPGNDVALVQVDADEVGVLKPARLGDSSAVKIGEVVAAIGNPFGLDGTLTTGIISGIDRTLPSGNDGRPIRGLLQTDTAVNPGNSGGALFNTKGEVVGINTALENPTGRVFAGIAYAVPINTPKRFLTQLIDGDTITHPRLGISGRTLTPEEADGLGVPQGVAIISVEGGSAADDAGLQAAEDGDGDVVVAIDGESMSSFEDLADYIDSKQVGDRVTLSVHRGGEDLELEAVLEAWDSSA